MKREHVWLVVLALVQVALAAAVTVSAMSCTGGESCPTLTTSCIDCGAGGSRRYIEATQNETCDCYPGFVLGSGDQGTTCLPECASDGGGGCGDAGTEDAGSGGGGGGDDAGSGGGAGGGDDAGTATDAGTDAGTATDAGTDAGTASDAGVDVTFMVRGVQRAPDWFAVQDGTGAFAPLTAAATAHVPVMDAQGRYALAWSCRSPANPSQGLYSDTYDVRVLTATVDELSQVTLSCDQGPSETSLSFNVTSNGLLMNEFGEHFFGFRGVDVSFSGVAGRGDFVSVSRDYVADLATRAVIARDVDFTSNGTTTVDLAPAATTAVPAPTTFRISGVPAGCAVNPRVGIDIVEGGFDLRLVTSKLTRYRAGYGPNSCDPDLVAPIFPAAMLVPADVYVLRAFLSSDVVGGVDVNDRVAGQVRLFRAAPATSVELIDLGPTAIPRTSGESVTAAAGGCTFQLAADATDRLYVAENVIVGGSTPGARWLVHATPARAGASPSFTLPDLAAVTGFNAAVPVPDCLQAWRLSAVRSTAATSAAFSAWSWPTGTLGDVTLNVATWRQP